MTTYEKQEPKLGVNDEVVYFDDGANGYPKKTVNGIVLESCEESILVKWEDLDEPTEYERCNITITGNQIFETGGRFKSDPLAVKPNEPGECHLLRSINAMCEESLPPDVFEKWESVIGILKQNRQQLKNYQP